MCQWLYNKAFQDEKGYRFKFSTNFYMDTKSVQQFVDHSIVCFQNFLHCCPFQSTLICEMTLVNFLLSRQIVSKYNRKITKTKSYILYCKLANFFLNFSENQMLISSHSKSFTLNCIVIQVLQQPFIYLHQRIQDFNGLFELLLSLCCHFQNDLSTINP